MKYSALRCKELLPSMLRKKIGKYSFLFFVGMFVGFLQIHAMPNKNKITIIRSRISLTEFFKEIQRQTGYTVVLDQAVKLNGTQLNANIKEATIREALNSCSQRIPFTYSIQDSVVYITDKEKNDLNAAVQSEIHGVVTDSSMKPIGGVAVMIKGTKKGTVTNDLGSYSISADKGDVLVFSFVGYKPQEITVGDNTEVNVTLFSSSTLEEVVMIGYGARKKQEVTAAIATISSKDMEDAHNGSTVSSALAGKIPGVTFRMSDGRPGSSASISIRNMGSPLYVIDGIIQDEGQFNNIAPNDIENISVLKDASAAIYGVQAANGVILVTTKRGKLGAPSRINIDAYTGWQNWFRFPKTENNYNWQQGKVEADVNQGRTPISRDELAKYKAATESEAADTGIYRSFDWYHFIVKGNAPLTRLNLNFTGGSDKINYYVSVSNLFQNSVLGREYKFNRTNIQSNIDAQVTKRLKIGAQINGRIEDRQNPGVPGTDDYWEARFAILRNTPWERPYANDNPNYLNDIGHNNENWGLLNYKLSGKYQDTWRVIQTNLTGEYKTPLEGLTLRGLFSYYYANRLLNNQEFTYDAYTYDPQTQQYNVTGGSSNPWRERDVRYVFTTDVQLQADYSHNFGKHHIGLTFVNERNRRHDLDSWLHAVPTSNSLPLIYFSTMDTYNDGDVTSSRIGYVGRFSYNYSNKYYLDIAGRHDASYLLSPDHKWGTFPSASASWRITNEEFFQNWVNTNIVSELKLRGSYGVTGDDRNLPIDEFSWMNAYNYNSGNPAILDGNTVITSAYRGIPITNITWIKSHMLDIGLDFGLFSNRLTGTFDYFKRKRTNLSGSKYDILLPNELGYSLPQESIASNSDKVQGIDASLKYNGSVKDVHFTIGGNFSIARSYLGNSYKPRFANSLDQYYNSRENRPNNLFWGYIADGQFQSQDEINNYKINNDGQGNKTQLPGDIKYKDLNGDGVIDYKDTRPIGWGSGANPIINGGLNLTASWKGLDLHLDFSYGSGYTFNRNWEMRWPYQNGGALQSIFWDSHWHHEDIYDVNSPWVAGKYPAFRFNDGGNNNNNKNSTFWLVNVKYLKCRNIEIGYSLPQSWLDKVNIKRARFYVNASNLFSLDNVHDYGIDPEIVDENGLTYPQSKYINVGCNISL